MILEGFSARMNRKETQLPSWIFLKVSEKLTLHAFVLGHKERLDSDLHVDRETEKTNGQHRSFPDQDWIK